MEMVLTGLITPRKGPPSMAGPVAWLIGPAGRAAGWGSMPAMADIVIRSATSVDHAGIVECLAEAFEPYRADYTPAAIRDTEVGIQNIERRMRELHVLVAVVGKDVVGTVGYHSLPSNLRTDSPAGHIRGMAVRPPYQGSGVAERLLAAAEDGLRGIGCSKVTLDTTDALKRARRFYEKQGYLATGKVQDFFGMRLMELEKDLISER